MSSPLDGSTVPADPMRAQNVPAVDPARVARYAEAASIADMARNFSLWLNDTYPPDLDAETVHWRRVLKVCEEAGEVRAALGAWVNENPRKPAGSAEDVISELADCVGAALGAIEHLTGHEGRSLDIATARVKFVCERVGVAVVAVADEEHAALVAEVERLRAWQEGHRVSMLNTCRALEAAEAKVAKVEALLALRESNDVRDEDGFVVVRVDDVRAMIEQPNHRCESDGEGSCKHCGADEPPPWPTRAALADAPAEHLATHFDVYGHHPAGSNPADCADCAATEAQP